ncbi:MAG: sodium:proton antiporter [Chromatiales bacterium 21-64-14]|nr:MAG: sodium:proton antiporter [Chromatiales bacterium 21-64-14]HQU15888.1 cation:proton antiporter [Gammaproteobacteria bacterium]
MQTSDVLVFSIFLIFAGAALLATLALYARQSLLVAYIVLGILIGPWGLRLISEPALIQDIAHVGIIFLLFLLGLNLHPQKLLLMLREATLVTVISSALFATIGFGVAFAFGYTPLESLVVGAASMFSSTIIGLKLLPSTALHHQHTGEIIISVLLLQDLIAILILLLLRVLGKGNLPATEIGLLVLSLPGLVLFAFLAERYLLIRLVRRYDEIQEYVFLVAIGWCLGLAELAAAMGLSQEIGAFVAGVALATSPIARYIAESLKPLRDFFLVIFFFAVGAGFQLPALGSVAIPATVLALLVVLLKPLIFKILLIWEGEKPALAAEVGTRLGQTSEFSLLIAYMAMAYRVVRPEVSYLIQLTVLLTFLVSSYWVGMRYPTPIANSARLRRD